MQIRMLACLPKVVAETVPQSLDDMNLLTLPFSDWLELEGQTNSAPYEKLRQKYDRAPPVFWDSTIEVDPGIFAAPGSETTRVLASIARGRLDEMAHAMHWFVGIAPIPPARSAVYFDVRIPAREHPKLSAWIEQAGLPRVYGESDKEYVVENREPQIHIRAVDHAPLAATLAFVTASRGLWRGPAYERVLEALASCSAEGLSWPSKLLLLVGAYEALVVGPAKEGLQSLFAKRFGVLSAGDQAALKQNQALAKTAYALRSDLLHGRSLEKNLQKSGLPPEEYVGVLSRQGLIVLTSLIRLGLHDPEAGAPADSQFWQRVDDASQAEDGVARMEGYLAARTLPRIVHQWEVS